MNPNASHARQRPSNRPLWNLRTKVMIIFLVLALVPLMVIGWFSLQITEKLIVSMVMRQLENAATDKTAILERWLDERKADMEVMAGTSLVRSMDAQRIQPYLDLIRKKYEVYKNLTVVAADGRLVCNSGTRPLQPPPEPAASDTTLRISKITYAPRQHESSFYVSAPIFAPNSEKRAGTIYGQVGTNKIIFFILNIFLGETGECYLVNEDGQFLAHKEPRRILSENISQSESFKNIFEKRDREKAYLDYRGIEVLGTSMNVAGTDWYIVVEQDRKEAFESASTLKSIIYLTIFLCIGSALALTWMISYHIVGPIRRLSRYADMIADSKTDQPIVKTTRKDEIGMLYRAFEHMHANLQQRHHHLREKVGLKDAQLRETDIMLEKTRRMAERSEKFAAMGRMGAAVAHEIRTPLTSLKLYLESAQEQIAKSAEDQEDFRIAMKQVNRIESSINRFLDFVKPEELVFSVIDVTVLIEDVLYMIRPLANRQECRLETRMQDHLPAVFGDRKLLAEALVNLMVNCLEAMEEQGTLSVSAKTDRFAQNNQTVACVRIDVQDTGCGISEEQMEHLFEPFYTTKAAGTGLGLPLVLNTIQSHGGTIGVQSTPGAGTAFRLYIPIESSYSADKDHGQDTAH
ncbi:MAG: ATP-binding protein [Desulfosalsimonas sp.]|uniref:ATP-binding protein n=1 Tax=Desulfosalsimonas sp. TaxID=3073848 RepID=UPI003970A84C